MTTSKRLTSKSGITIPKDVRLSLGWQPGMSVDLVTTEEGALLIRPHVNHCRFCGGVENIRKYKDVCVCPDCAAKMKEAV
ncbi:MAG: AbrB/MazE/SpoVT family DNA-binding domain-containing protein [Ruminococcus sp.]|nr:AbrB/MazE/SpoVT family DNA-binding domain-containing protein [Ruminococcus sp.]